MKKTNKISNNTKLRIATLRMKIRKWTYDTAFGRQCYIFVTQLNVINYLLIYLFIYLFIYLSVVSYYMWMVLRRPRRLRIYSSES